MTLSYSHESLPTNHTHTQVNWGQRLQKNQCAEPIINKTLNPTETQSAHTIHQPSLPRVHCADGLTEAMIARLGQLKLKLQRLLYPSNAQEHTGATEPITRHVHAYRHDSENNHDALYWNDLLATTGYIGVATVLQKELDSNDGKINDLRAYGVGSISDETMNKYPSVAEVGLQDALYLSSDQFERATHARTAYWDDLGIGANVDQQDPFPIWESYWHRYDEDACDRKFAVFKETNQQIARYQGGYYELQQGGEPQLFLGVVHRPTLKLAMDDAFGLYGDTNTPNVLKHDSKKPTTPYALFH